MNKGQYLELKINSVSYNNNLHKWYYRFVPLNDFLLSGFSHIQYHEGQTINCQIKDFDNKTKLCLVELVQEVKDKSIAEQNKVLPKFEFLSKVKKLLAKYQECKDGPLIQLIVVKNILDPLSFVRYCSLCDEEGNVYYASSKMVFSNGRVILAANPVLLPYENAYAVTIVKVLPKDKHVNNAIQKSQGTVSHSIENSLSRKKSRHKISVRKNKLSFPHLCYDPFREEWKAKLNNCKLIKYPSSGICSKCHKFFAESEGFVIPEINSYLCDTCYDSIYPANESKYKNPFARFISVPMGGKLK